MRRKLQNQNGVTIVFALVIFLIMALFSYVMVNASLTAVHSADASRMDEQAYVSVRSAALLLRKELNGQALTYNPADTSWSVPESSPDVVKNVLIPLLNDHSKQISIEVNAETTEIHDTFGTVKISLVKIENLSTEKLDSGEEADAPILTLKFEHCSAANEPPGYIMNAVMRANPVQKGETDGTYNVTFDGKNMTFRLGDKS